MLTLFSSKNWSGAGQRKTLSGIAALAVMLTGVQACRAQKPWPLWDAYAKRFLDDQGRVIDRSAGDRTTSEGEAYSMFFSLVDNDRPRFDKLLNWTVANLAGGDLTLRLPAWSWGKNAAGEWKTIDSNSAADADLWMAYTLLEAGRLWKEPRYETLGRLMATRIAKEEVVVVPELGTVLAPGPKGFHPDDQTWLVNPSYMPPPVLVGLAKRAPNGPWKAIAKTLPAVTGGAISHQFAMDWVSAGSAGIHPSAPPSQPTTGTQQTQASGSYDAIRVYLWLGIAEPGTAGLHNLLGRVSGMGGYLGTATTPPLEVSPEGTVVRSDAPVGFSAAMIPYLSSIGAKAAAKTQADRLVATKDPESGLYGRTMEYYDQNLALFSTGWSEHRYLFERDGALKVSWK
ncbi:cellulose synthase complex periplasmic endoglucanase BcsZ [Granulicella tundricola]|uniref:cellulose synthase complex periplasmic endoglucanase BcsZ n=1 Tax=Granulicella tundricola TaxID=940615 RepID=UPI0038CBFCA2